MRIATDKRNQFFDKHKNYFCGGIAAFFVFPLTGAAEKHLVSEKTLNKRFFKGTGVVLAGIECSQKSVIFASGIPVQKRAEIGTLIKYLR